MKSHKLHQPNHEAPCPCDSGKAFEQCCGPCLNGSDVALTAEALMRSRYTAFVREDHSYLLASWHPTTRPSSLEADSKNQTKWLGLSIKRSCSTAPDRALVEFVARYRIAGRAFRLHETSRFVREAGRWLYFDGDIHESPAKAAKSVSD